MVYQAQQKKELAWRYCNIVNTLTESEFQRNAVKEALDVMIQQTKEDYVEVGELKRQLEAYKEISKLNKKQ